MTKIISICSTYQALKKYLFYLANGVVADIIPVTVEEMFHNPINEAISVLPYTVFVDHDWQSSSSLYGTRSRNERRPK